MSAVPVLSPAQWRRIEPILPPNRRDQRMVAALVFREFDGCGIRDACDLFQVTRTRMSEWERALRSDGTLDRVMNELGIERVAAQGMRASGGRVWWKRDRALAAGVEAVKLRNFRDSLR